MTPAANEGDAILQMQGVTKTFTLHHQHDARLDVLQAVNLEVHAGESVVLDGPSGMGKSTLLKLIHASYRATSGSIRVRQVDGSVLDVTAADPRALLNMRKASVGYVSQFLRVIPRVAALDVVAEPLLEEARGSASAEARARDEAAAWLERLRIPQKLWSLPPSTFSGGEQQRINIARSLIRAKPLLLLDEPTASLDAVNTATVVEIIREAVDRGAALVGIFHDPAMREAVATRRIDMSQFRSQA